MATFDLNALWPTSLMSIHSKCTHLMSSRLVACAWQWDQKSAKVKIRCNALALLWLRTFFCHRVSNSFSAPPSPSTVLSYHQACQTLMKIDHHHHHLFYYQDDDPTHHTALLINQLDWRALTIVSDTVPHLLTMLPHHRELVIWWWFYDDTGSHWPSCQTCSRHPWPRAPWS